MYLILSYLGKMSGNGIAFEPGLSHWDKLMTTGLYLSLYLLWLTLILQWAEQNVEI